MVKHRFREVKPLGVAAGVMVAGTVLLLPLMLLHLPSAVPGLKESASVVAVGVLGTGVGFAIFYGLVTTVGPARTFIVTYLAPAFAVVYGALLLDEEITVATIVGLALIVGGSYLAAEGRLPGSSEAAASGRPSAARRRSSGAARYRSSPVSERSRSRTLSTPLGADRVAPRERPARPVEPEAHRGVDVLGAADPAAERERRLVHELADDPLERRHLGGPVERRSRPSRSTR